MNINWKSSIIKFTPERSNQMKIAEFLKFIIMNIHQFYLTNKRLFDIKQKLTDLFQQQINQHDKVPSL